MLPAIVGARPGYRNMMFSPYSDSPRLLPDRKPSPKPTNSNNDPTPQAMPNMVRNERSLWAHSVRKICPRMSRIVRMTAFNREHQYRTRSHWQALRSRLELTKRQQDSGVSSVLKQ